MFGDDGGGLLDNVIGIFIGRDGGRSVNLGETIVVVAITVEGDIFIIIVVVIFSKREGQFGI